MDFEFLIPRRPVSLQARRTSLQAWKKYVYGEASKTWSGVAQSRGNLHVTIVYLFDSYPTDIDNIIKPIQDALVSLVYVDDVLVRDVQAHRRSLIGPFDFVKLPKLLQTAVVSGNECVYVRIRDSYPLEEYL